MHVTWHKKITIIQRPSPSGRLNLWVGIEKHTSVLKSAIKNWITNQTKLTAVDIIALDHYWVGWGEGGGGSLSKAGVPLAERVTKAPTLEEHVSFAFSNIAKLLNLANIVSLKHLE